MPPTLPLWARCLVGLGAGPFFVVAFILAGETAARVLHWLTRRGSRPARRYTPRRYVG